MHHWTHTYIASRKITQHSVSTAPTVTRPLNISYSTAHYTTTSEQDYCQPSQRYRTNSHLQHVSHEQTRQNCPQVDIHAHGHNKLLTLRMAAVDAVVALPGGAVLDLRAPLVELCLADLVTLALLFLQLLLIIIIIIRLLIKLYNIALLKWQYTSQSTSHENRHTVYKKLYVKQLKFGFNK